MRFDNDTWGIILAMKSEMEFIEHYRRLMYYYDLLLLTPYGFREDYSDYYVDHIEPVITYYYNRMLKHSPIARSQNPN